MTLLKTILCRHRAIVHKASWIAHANSLNEISCSMWRCSRCGKKIRKPYAAEKISLVQLTTVYAQHIAADFTMMGQTARDVTSTIKGFSNILREVVGDEVDQIDTL